MIAKLIVHDTDRETARRRMLRALAEFRIEGPPTLIGFHAALLTEPCFVDGGTCHGLVESEELAQRAKEMTDLFSHRTTTMTSGSDGMHTRERVVAVEVDGRSFDVRLHATEPPWAALGRRRRERAARPGPGTAPARSRARCRARSSRCSSATGDEVAAGEVICVIEAMKMENEIAAPVDGVVTELGIASGQGVTTRAADLRRRRGRMSAATSRTRTSRRSSRASSTRRRSRARP